MRVLYCTVLYTRPPLHVDTIATGASSAAARLSSWALGGGRGAGSGPDPVICGIETRNRTDRVATAYQNEDFMF